MTPVTRLEFLAGKQLPYVVVSLISFAVLFLMSVFLFGVPLKGSFLVLLLGAVLYVVATTGHGRGRVEDWNAAHLVLDLGKPPGASRGACTLGRVNRTRRI